MASQIRSGDGERSAMLGYVPQYKIAARLIYESLLNGELEWIKVADPEAGSLDDILIATNGRLDAYQVKWAEYTNAISFKDFIRNESRRNGNTKPSLFKQLTESWKILKNRYPERNLTIHLAHKQIASSNPSAKLPTDKTPPDHPHFQAFLIDCWSTDRHWANSSLSSAPLCWQPALSKLMEVSELSENDFLNFVSNCELEFNYKLPDFEQPLSQQQATKHNDINQIYSLLTQLVGGEQRIIEVSKDSLLKKLGWEQRFNFFFKHDFPVQIQLYEEIAETVESLSTALENINQGYIAVLGTPGSGKSTTLTQTLKYKQGYKLIRYYAYVPNSPQQGRGEANNFLHDITLSLSQHGFRGLRTGSLPKSREEYLSLLSEQLKQASEKWLNENILTVILVDGLDHIQREQNPQISLLADLPLPETIPVGVLFILGSQTLELDNLPDPIKIQLGGGNRSIVISPLTRSNTYSIIESYTTDIFLDDTIKNLIYEKSSGHPLYLLYLLQYISENRNDANNLTELSPYEGNIENNYSIYWKKIENNQSLIALLGLLSRIRIPTSEADISNLADELTIREFIKETAHYFNKDNNSNWSFFHNSFRQFILDKTSCNTFGHFDENKNIQYHKQLAELCSRENISPPLSWEKIYHLFHANEFHTVIEIGRQNYFREQFFNKRHLENITDDLDCVLLAAKESNEPLPIIRSFLIECELRERMETLGQIDMLDLLFYVEGIDSALNHLYDGQSLNVEESYALRFCKSLLIMGNIYEAKRIFDIAEPIHYLSGSDGIKRAHGGHEVIKNWVDIAHNFLDIRVIIKTIHQTRNEQENEFEEPDDSSLHHYLIRYLINSIVESKSETKISDLFEFFYENDEFDDHLIHLCLLICKERAPNSLTTNAFKIIHEWAEDLQDELSDSEKLLIAEIHYRLNNDIDAAKFYISKVSQPKLYEYDGYKEWKNLAPFADRIRFNRLNAALGNEIHPIQAIPDSTEGKNRGNVLFERHLVSFANIWGNSWRNYPVYPNTIIRAIKPAFILLTKPFNETRDWLGWYEIRAVAVEFFKFTIKATAEHSRDCLNALANEFRADWDKRYWPSEWQREIALALYEVDNEAEFLVQTLEKVEKQIAEDDNFQDRALEYSKLAIDWAKHGEYQKANILLPKIFNDSFGIYHDKDWQFSHWASWLKELIPACPDLAEVELPHFSSALVNLEISNRGRGTQEAGRDLIATATEWNPEYGYKLLKWLFKEKGLTYGYGLIGFLSGMLNHSNPPTKEVVTAASKLLLPFQVCEPDDLPELIGFYCHKEIPGKANQLIKQTTHAIKTNLLPSNRYSWLKGIVEGERKSGQNNVELIELTIKTPKTTYSSRDPSLTLKSGEQLDEKEATLRVSTTQNLIQFIKSIESVEYFRWHELIVPYLEKMNVEQLDELYELISPFSPGQKVLCDIANAYTQREQFEKATLILNNLLNTSSPLGWDLFGGGHKQSLYAALVMIDANRWRSEALHNLVDDYIGEYRYPSNLVQSIKKIVPIIFEKPDMRNIWEEIKEHVYQLNDFVEINQLPSFSYESSSERSANFIIKFAFDMLDIITPELAQYAHQAIISFCQETENEKIIHDEIKKRLSQTGLIRIKVLALLESILDINDNFVLRFKRELSTLCSSDDLTTRSIATNLSEKLKFDSIPNTKKRTELSLTYSLELPEIGNRESIIPFSALKPGETYPDIDDPLELISPLSDDAKIISKMANLPFENIVYRTSELMKSLVPMDKWNKAAEENYLEWMEGFDLKLTYNRLRPQIAKLALSHVACELLDAGYISEQDGKFLKSIFKRADNIILDLEPNTRPEQINIPRGFDRELSRDYDEWLANAHVSLPNLVEVTLKQDVIIGELTQWQWLDWEKAKESRLSMVCHSEFSNHTDTSSSSSFFPSTSQSASEYPHISRIPEPSLVIYGSNLYIDHGGFKWLALNPNVGVHLGWQYSPEGNFRWVDDSGNIMVESLYWKDGPIRRLPPKFDDICSEGWLVIASSLAINTLQNLSEDMTKIDVIIRNYGKNPYDQKINVAEQRRIWSDIVNH